MIKTIVTDIEGTTSSLSFVKDVLFPYARQHLAAYLDENGDKPQIQNLIADIHAIAGRKLNKAELLQQLTLWIDEDKKVTPLKLLQGLIWQSGYANGDFKGHIYEDAVRNLRQWHEQGIHLYVYSSGSVQAQKLLFAHTDYGDLCSLFSGFFDTRIGAKGDSRSYTRIVERLQLGPTEILFLSDMNMELDAARAAGMHTLCLVRGANVNPAATHQQAANFDAIDPYHEPNHLRASL